jgi:hypothetical protein
MKIPGFAWRGALAVLVLCGCKDETVPETTGCMTTLDCSGRDEICIDGQCAVPEPEGGGGGENCSASPDLEEGAGGTDSEASVDDCTRLCQAAVDCPDSSELFDCRANCERTTDLVESTSCHAPWARVIRCGDECGACALCTEEIRALEDCFQEYCENIQDPDVCQN